MSGLQDLVDFEVKSSLKYRLLRHVLWPLGIVWLLGTVLSAGIANYFVQAGWKRGVKWGTAVSVPEGLDWRPLQSRLAAPNCARVHGRLSRWKSVAEWRAMGVIPSRNDLPDYEQASLFQPDGPDTPAWLLTGNYRVILDYNCSNFYALSVGLLADAVATGVPDE